MKAEHETENATMNANVTINRPNEKWNTKPTSQVETDAKLIAAAPDLLEALIRVVAHIDNYEPYDDINLDKARAALAKATGE